MADGLRQRGWPVSVCGHSEAISLAAFDLVHVHHFGRAAFRLATTTRRPPMVFTTHDPFAMNRLPVGWKRRFTDRYILHTADLVIACSHTERNFLERSRGVPPRRLAVIPNGIPTSVFEPVPDPAASGQDLLFVGQLQDFKGLDYLLHALPAVRQSFSGIRLRIVYQTDALLERYREHAARLGLNGIIDFAGPRTAPELARLYSTAAVVVSPSLGECLSTVVLEAMCCGAAVVATDVGGIREQLDELTGVIVPPRDPRALAGAICGLLADSGRRRRMGEAACMKARAEFSVRRMIDRHVHAYEELLDTDERAA